MPYSIKQYDIRFCRLAQYDYVLILSDPKAKLFSKSKFVLVAPMIFCHRFDPVLLKANPPQWIRVPGFDGAISGLPEDVFVITNQIRSIPKAQIAEFMNSLNGDYIEPVKRAVKDYFGEL